MVVPKISLIVPVYNAARYLEECLASICSQVTVECEVILIDDGSNDRSVEIIKEICASKLLTSQFILKHIANSGPGEARNVGVRNAKARYIGFLDSDDLLLPGYFRVVLEAIQSATPSIIQFPLLRFQTGELPIGKVIKTHNSPNGVYDLCDVRNDIFATGKWYPPARIFLRELLLTHPFPTERVFYEDLTTLPYIFLSDGKVVLLDNPLIAYRNNEMGTTRSHLPEHATTLYEFFKELSALPRQQEIDLLRVHVGRAVLYFVSELGLKNIPVTEIIADVRDIGNRFGMLRMLNFADSLFLVFPRAYFFAEKLRHKLSFICE